MEMQREYPAEAEKPITANNRLLLTPIGLQQYLLAQFDSYCNDKKPEALKVNTEAPALGTSKEVLEDFKKDKKATASKFFGAASAFFKKTVSLAYDHANRTHASTTEFIANEMEHILRQPCSALKKMTDLTILFHGLYNYMATRNSKDLKPLLEEVMQSLWAGTPQVIPVYRGNLIIGNTSADKQAFVTRFEKQIQVAQKLIMSNSTAVDRALNEKRMRALNEQAMNEGVPPKLGGDNNNPQEWQYRCSELAELGHQYTAHGAYQPPTAWMGEGYKAFLDSLTVDHYTLTGESAVLMPMQKRRESDPVVPLVMPVAPRSSGTSSPHSSLQFHACSPMPMAAMPAFPPSAAYEPAGANSNNSYQGAPPVYPLPHSYQPPAYGSFAAAPSGGSTNIYGAVPVYASPPPPVYGYPGSPFQANNRDNAPVYMLPAHQPAKPLIKDAATDFFASPAQPTSQPQVPPYNQPVAPLREDSQYSASSLGGPGK